MNQKRVFGELRGLLCQPCEKSWEGICTLVFSLPAAQQTEVIPYLQHHLLQWPVDLCIAPWAWIEPIFRGDPAPPTLALARSIRVCNKKKIHHKFRKFIQSDTIAHIESLHIEATNIGGKRSFEALAKATQLQHLSKLSLATVKMNDEHLETLLNANQLNGVKTLHLETNNLTSRSIDLLSECDFVLNLNELHLDNNLIGTNGFLTLSKAEFKHLKVLSMGMTGIDDDGAIALAQSTHFGHLKQLELSEGMIGQAGIHALVNSPAWKNLELLSLGANPIEDRGLQHIAERTGMPHLSHIGLRSTGINDAGVTALAESSQSRQLNKLDLRCNNITESGCLALGQSKHFEKLDALFLSINPCSTDGIDALLEAPSFSSLRRLELAHVQLTSPESIGKCQQLKHLEELELVGNRLSGDLHKLVGTQSFEQLRMLGLDHCWLHDHDLKSILTGLQFPNLIALYLSENLLTTKGLGALFDRSFERLMLVEADYNDDIDPMVTRAIKRRYGLRHQKQVFVNGTSRLHSIWSIVIDAAEPIWETMANEETQRRHVQRQLKQSGAI